MNRDRVPLATPPRRGRVPRPVLLSNLVAGALWLLVVCIGSWPLALIGLVYVAAASLYFELTSPREVTTVRRLVLVSFPAWFVAAAMWTWVLVGIELPTSASGWFLPAVTGLVVGTGCFSVWQITAFLVRQFLPGDAPLRASAPPWAD